MTEVEQLIQAPAGHFINQICIDALTTKHYIFRVHFKFSNGTSTTIGSIPPGETTYQICGDIMPRGMHRITMPHLILETGALVTCGVRGFKLVPNDPGTIDSEFIIDLQTKVEGHRRAIPGGTRTLVKNAEIGEIVSGLTVKYTPGFPYYEIMNFTVIPDPMLNIAYLGDWSPWSECDSSGKKVRTRRCMNTSSYSFCTGNTVDIADCQNGYWTDWEPWSSCMPIDQSSAQCDGTGVMRRKRTYVPAQNGGTEAPWVEPEETKACNLDPCPVDGQFSAWSAWSACDAKCGKQSQIKRTRTYTPAKNGGRELSGPLEETISCEGPPCPIDGQFSAWSDWSGCVTNGPCGEGYQQRNRTYTPAQFGGKDLEGTLEEKMNCMIECPELDIVEPSPPKTDDPSPPKTDDPSPPKTGEDKTKTPPLYIIIIALIFIFLSGVAYFSNMYAKSKKKAVQQPGTDQISVNAS